MAFTLPQLEYDYDALEPHIDSETMKVHHGKHHQSYVDKVNAAIEGREYEKYTIEDLVAGVNDLPENVREAVRNHGGGHANHSLFWTIIAPDGGGKPSGTLAEAINDSFGNFDEFKKQFSDAAKTQFGSGWAWLVVDSGTLKVESTSNQNSPLTAGRIPIMAIDVWEHAYYLKYQNRRPDYIEAFYNVINWDEVQRRYELAQKNVVNEIVKNPIGSV